MYRGPLPHIKNWRRMSGSRPPGIVAKEARPEKRDYVSNGDYQPDHKNDARDDADEGEADHCLASSGKYSGAARLRQEYWLSREQQFGD